MLSSLLAYDADGNVVATLDHMVVRDEGGNVIGLVDFAAHEEAGGEHTAVWTVEDAKGSKVWPEWLGGRAHHFKVELEGKPGKKRIAALVHRESGHRRDRAILEANVAQRIAVYDPEPADIRDLVGGPDRPIPLDEHGRTRPSVKATPSRLPMIEVIAPLASAVQPIDTPAQVHEVDR